MYAVKIRPFGASAWFWLGRGASHAAELPQRATLTTLRKRAAIFVSQDAVLDYLRGVDLPDGTDFRAVKLGAHR